MVDVIEEVGTQERVCERIQGPTYHLHVYRGQRNDDLITAHPRGNCDPSVVPVDDLLLSVRDVLRPDVYEREAVWVLGLIPERVGVGALDLVGEGRVELHVPLPRPEVVDQVFSLAGDLDPEVFVLGHFPLEPEWIVSRLR